MASVYSRSAGTHEIQFTDASGRRPVIRLGPSSRLYADDVKRRIEYILSCHILNRPLDVATSKWIADLPAKMRTRFAKAGLVDDTGARTIAELCAYCKKHFGGKRGTQTNYGHTEHNLTTYFGAERNIQSITKGDAREWKQWLTTSAKRRFGDGGLAPTTYSKRCKVAKQFFEFAVEKGWLTANPFVGLKGLVDSNNEREAFIDDATIRRVLANIPDPQLQLIVALVRYAGLRCPSEIKPLRWDWIDWDAETMKIYAPKTERYQNGKWRLIPLFKRLRPYLDKAWHAAPPGTHLVVNIGTSNAALWNRVGRALDRAGVEHWPKRFHNLRSSLMTELEEQGYSLIAITKWLGNSPSVAKKHYLQVTKEQFRRAVTGAGLPSTKSAAKSAAPSKRNGAQPSAKLR